MLSLPSPRARRILFFFIAALVRILLLLISKAPVKFGPQTYAEYRDEAYDEAFAQAEVVDVALKKLKEVWGVDLIIHHAEQQGGQTFIEVVFPPSHDEFEEFDDDSDDFVQVPAVPTSPLRLAPEHFFTDFEEPTFRPLPPILVSAFPIISAVPIVSVVPIVSAFPIVSAVPIVGAFPIVSVVSVVSAVPIVPYPPQPSAAYLILGYMLLGCGLGTFSLASSILMLRWALLPASSNPAPSPSKASPFATPSLASEPSIHASVDGAQPEPLHRPALRVESETEPAATIQDAVLSIASAHANANVHTHLELVSILPPLQSLGEDRRAPRGRSQTEPKVIPRSTFAAPSLTAVPQTVQVPSTPPLSPIVILSPPSSNLVTTASILPPLQSPGEDRRVLRGRSQTEPKVIPRSTFAAPSPAAVLSSIDLPQIVPDSSLALPLPPIAPTSPSSDLVATAPVGERARSLDSAPSTSPKSLSGPIYQLLFYARLLRFSTVLNRHRLTPFWRKLSSVLLQYCRSLPDTSLLLSTARYVVYHLLFQTPQTRLLIAMYVNRLPSQAPQPLRLVLANSFSRPGTRAPDARAPVDTTTTTTAAAATQRAVLSPHRSLARVSEADVPLWLGRASGIRARSRRASRLGSSYPPESEEQTCFSDLGGWDVV